MTDAPQTSVQPARQKQIPSTTPAQAKQTSSQEFKSGNLDKQRKMVLEDAYMLEVSLDYFQRLMPLPPAAAGSDSWDTIMGELQQCDALNHEAWTRLPGGTSFKEQHEDVAFKPLETIINDTITACQKRFPSIGVPTLKLRLLPNRTPSGDKKDTSRPDGVMSACAQPDPSMDDYTWTSISVMIELKSEHKRDLDGKLDLKNSEQCVWGLQQMLWANPDRRFAFAVTIEDTSVRLWLAHRAAVLVSTPFHLQKSCTYLVRVFLSFAFGSRTALGWDPTMKRLLNGASRFNVTIGEVEYTITEPIADHRARALHGSACRVFLAHSAKQEFAIKDVWRNRDRVREGQNFNDVLQNIEAMKDELGMDREMIRRHFVNVIDHGDVIVNHSVDGTLETIMHGEDVSPDAILIRADTVTSDKTQDTIGWYRSSTRNTEAPHGRGRVNDSVRSTEIHHRIHYRTVMENVGKPLHHVDSLEDALKALSDVVKACKMMCLAGYNHRDLSTGNIIVDKSGQGRLGDLEFAKKFHSDQGGHTERAGTLDFMAIEVISAEYSFRDLRTVAKYGERPFRHNAGHDLESIWWIAVFLLYHTIIGNKVDHAKAVQQKRYMDDFFDLTNRVRRFQSDSPVAAMSRQLDSKVEGAIDHLESMVEALKGAYRTVENAADDDEGRNLDFLSVHDIFLTDLLEMSRLFHGTRCTRLAVATRKRERNVSGVDESPTVKRGRT